MEEVVLEKGEAKAKGVAKEGAVVLAKAAAGDLLASLGLVSGIVERRGSMPILANVLICKKGKSLELTGTDLDLQMRVAVDLGHGSSDATTTVNARKLVEILKAMPAEQAMTLTLKDEKLVVAGGKSRFTVQTLPAVEFPLVKPSERSRAVVKVDQKAFGDLIGMVQYGMAIGDVRFYLNGMLMELSGKTMRVVSTDGHRMAVAEMELDSDVGECEVIIPRKAVLELSRLLKNGSGEMEIVISDVQATFKFNGLEFTNKLVEGKFPDYRRVIPKSSRNFVTLDREMMLQALQRANLMAGEKVPCVELSFQPGSESQSVELRCSNAMQEEAREEIGIDYAGEAMKIGFNVSYLIEALGNMDNDTVEFGMNDGGSSILITDPKVKNMKAVVMPMRV